MKFLLCSDLHANEKAARARVDQAVDEKADFLVCAGDLGVMRERYEETTRIVASFPGETVLVPGNGESYEELAGVCDGLEKTTLLHGTGAVIADLPFWGLGGGVPVTPFGDWSYDFTEEEAGKMLADCPNGAVLVSHSPPLGILDETSSGFSAGSQAVLDVLQERRPRLLVCGHIHDCGGRQVQSGDTLVVNAGPRGVLVEWQ